MAVESLCNIRMNKHHTILNTGVHRSQKRSHSKRTALDISLPRSFNIHYPGCHTDKRNIMHILYICFCNNLTLTVTHNNTTNYVRPTPWVTCNVVQCAHVHPTVLWSTCSTFDGISGKFGSKITNFSKNRMKKSKKCCWWNPKLERFVRGECNLMNVRHVLL